jgi:hypothetical protein
MKQDGYKLVSESLLIQEKSIRGLERAIRAADKLALKYRRAGKMPAFYKTMDKLKKMKKQLNIKSFGSRGGRARQVHLPSIPSRKGVEVAL